MTTGPTPQPLLDAWENTLAAEQQAVFGYQVVAAQLRAEGDVAADTAAADLARHGRRQAVAESQVLQLGATPVPPPAAYGLPAPVTDSAAAADLATRLERACAQAYADLVAASGPSQRDRPAGWLAAAAGAETRWAGAVPPLPGLGDRAPALR